MMVRRGWLALVVLWWLSSLSIAPAAADTGGSMGGGSWSSGRSSSSGYSGGRSYSSSGGYRSSSSYHGGGGGVPMSGGMMVMMLIGLGIVAFIRYAISQRSSSPSLGLAPYTGGGYSPSTDVVDVSVLRIAIDGRARKFVQAELARIAGTADTGTATGRAAMLREVGLLLRRVRDAWVYGGAVNEPMRWTEGARANFARHVDDARARFRHETVRNEQGAITAAAAPESIPRSHEGEGLILVSLIVAARTELFTVAHIGDGEDLRKALEAAAYRSPSDLVAIEIVWQPSDPDDRLSSLELEAKYPRPELIPITGALVGKVFCDHCGGPFPGELVSCPHCGAPAPGREAAAARAA